MEFTTSEKKRRTIVQVVLHVLAWVLVIFLPDILFDMPHNTISDTKRVLHFVLAFSFFYFNYFVFVPMLLLKKKQVWFALVVVVSIVFTWYVNDFVMEEARAIYDITVKEQKEKVDQKAEARKKLWRERHRAGENTGTAAIVLISFLLSTIARETREWYRQDEEKKNIEKERLISELSFLKSQVNPHFLFNSLNGIYALALKKSDDAPNAILQLSDLLRHMLYEGDKELIPLEKEVAYLKNYIELQKLRMPKNADIVFDVEGNMQGLLVAPLLFISFVENAFKHGTGIGTPHIKVGMKVESGTINFWVTNKISQANNKDEASGIGLQNVKKRLELLYPANYQLKITEQNGEHSVYLTINTEQK